MNAYRTMRQRLVGWIFYRLMMRVAGRRPPDFVVGDPEQPYLRRWWVIPRNPILNVYLHHIRRSDDDTALHCHPWASVSLMLYGQLTEVLPRHQSQPAALDHSPHGLTRRTLRAGKLVWRTGGMRHRLEIDPADGPCWTLFITGPVYRRWGFWCAQGWRHWRDYVSDANRGVTGRGCA